MNIAALLTSAGINIAVCVVLLSLYSVLRKQPSNVNVYFGRRLAQARTERSDPFCLYRLIPSASWIVKAWETTEEEILAIGGLDAVVFFRIIVFSFRVFCIAAVICIFLVLPLNYFGQEMIHKQIHSESLEVFTIGNVKQGSKWLWAHCLALYVISCSACVLLYFEYKNISNMRLEHITGSLANRSHFTILVRAIPRCSGESYSDSVRNFFTNYHALSYLSHQMVYRCGAIQKLMNDAEKVYNMLKSATVEQNLRPGLLRCGLCGGTVNSFKKLHLDRSIKNRSHFGDLDLCMADQECAAAFVFFKTRYAAVVASQVLQSSNPMLWVTDWAPEPHDVYWSNLCIPYRQLWVRKIATLLASIVFMFLFLVPVTLVQGLTQLYHLQKMFPFLKGILRRNIMSQVVTGYLPSVILMLFLYTVPPTMMCFSAVEGSISRSGRMKSACCKVLYFTVWNIFFVNVLSGSVIGQLNAISSPKDIPGQLARAVPTQASFFMTYVLTSGWAGLSCEVVQPLALLCNCFRRFVLRHKDQSNTNSPLSFPYHTEIPRVLIFGLLGFSLSILAPLILPLLLVYFLLAYLVYRNQIINVYVTKYETGGKFWPIVHNMTIFSLVLTQIIALGVFGLRRSPVASGFTIPLVICTLLFNEYCRQRFHPIFKHVAAQILIDMDRKEEQSRRMEELQEQLSSAYVQFKLPSHDSCGAAVHSNGHNLQAPPPCMEPGEQQPIQINDSGAGSSTTAETETEELTRS